MDSFAVGKILESGGISEVIKSNNPKYKVGDLYSGMVGILGMPGMTAYTGLFKISQPKKGEMVFVSAAAGAVGQVVCQISKMFGSASNGSKVDFFLNEMKLDGAFNYKKYDLKKKLDELCPNRIDIYWDNVGVVSCGMISQYNGEEPYGIKNIMCVLTKSIHIQGFVVTDYYDEIYEQFLKEMNEWLKSSKLKYKEDVVVGIEKMPEAFLGLLNGKNFGKLIVKVDKNTKL
nr:13116_t:CDS:2 [Entrophospora candida]